MKTDTEILKKLQEVLQGFKYDENSTVLYERLERILSIIKEAFMETKMGYVATKEK